MANEPDMEKITRQLFPDMPEPEQVSEFYEAIGLALSAWQFVEQGLYLLFERAVEPRRPGAAGCGCHTLQFAGKLMVTDAAVRFALLAAKPEDIVPLTEEWTKLHDKARDRSTRRNHFAHYQTNVYFQEKDKGKKVQLQPVAYDFRFAAGLVKRKAYTLNDIRANAASFHRLAKKLNAFLPKIPPQK